MKKKLIITIIVGFVSLIMGLILAGIGFFTGGVVRLEEVSAPEEIHKIYSDLHTINIDFIPHDVILKESRDNHYHVTYANSKNNTFSSLNLSENKGTLILSSQEQKFAIDGIMQFVGESLAQHKIDVQTVTIEVPKGKMVNKLEGQNHYYGTSVIENVHIKEIDLEARLYLNNAEIDSGKITSSYFQAEQSNLKHTNISILGNNIHLIDTILDTVNIKQYKQLDAVQVTLLGENAFSPEQTLAVTNLSLTDTSLQDINLDIHNQLDIRALAEHLGYQYDTIEELEKAVGDMSYFKKQAEHVGIFTKDKYENLPVKKDSERQILTVEKKDSQNKLTIHTTNATINLRTPK